MPQLWDRHCTWSGYSSGKSPQVLFWEAGRKDSNISEHHMEHMQDSMGEWYVTHPEKEEGVLKKGNAGHCGKQ